MSENSANSEPRELHFQMRKSHESYCIYFSEKANYSSISASKRSHPAQYVNDNRWRSCATQHEVACKSVLFTFLAGCVSPPWQYTISDTNLSMLWISQPFHLFSQHFLQHFRLLFCSFVVLIYHKFYVFLQTQEPQTMINPLRIFNIRKEERWPALAVFI